MKENLKKTINESCIWVQRELKKETMSPSIVAAIPETLKSISELVNSLENMKIY